jgi:hypothetical protein
LKKCKNSAEITQKHHGWYQNKSKMTIGGKARQTDKKKIGSWIDRTECKIWCRTSLKEANKLHKLLPRLVTSPRMVDLGPDDTAWATTLLVVTMLLIASDILAYNKQGSRV